MNEIARSAPEGPLGMAGGDGSLAPVAEVAIERDVPFVVDPVRHENHFARDLGLDRDDPLGALEAFGGPRAPDRRRPGERPTLPEQRLPGRLRAARPPPGAPPAAAGSVAAPARARAARPDTPGALGLKVDGAPVSARVLLVANNDYKLELFSLGERERLDEGRLHLYVGRRRPAADVGGADRRAVRGRRARRVARRPRSTASRSGSRRRSTSRSSPGRYACWFRQAESTLGTCGTRAPPSGTSSSANQRNSATSSAGCSSPPTMRAFQ